MYIFIRCTYVYIFSPFLSATSAGLRTTTEVFFPHVHAIGVREGGGIGVDLSQVRTNSLLQYLRAYTLRLNALSLYAYAHRRPLNYRFRAIRIDRVEVCRNKKLLSDQYEKKLIYHKPVLTEPLQRTIVVAIRK